MKCPKCGSEAKHIVFAKHKDTEREFMFEVPKHIKNISVNDKLAVDTKFGLSYAIATSEILTASEAICTRLGAYLPLKQVVCVITSALVGVCQKAEFDLPF